MIDDDLVFTDGYSGTISYKMGARLGERGVSRDAVEVMLAKRDGQLTSR